VESGLDFNVIWENLSYFFIGRYPKGPLGGVGLTLYLAVVSLALSFIGGLVLGLLSVSRNRLLRWGSLTVIQTIRGMPLLMVIFWMFFLLPALLGGGMPAAWTIIMALTLFTSAYMSEIVRAGITGIGTDRGCRFDRALPRAGDVLHHSPAGAAEHDPLLRQPVRVDD